MNIRDLDLQKILGAPALSFVGLEKYYTRAEHADHPVFKKDHAWFLSNPRQQRVFRPALADELNHADASFEFRGKRINAPRLWVMVHWRYGGQHIFVEPVYRGSCFWDVDADEYMLPFAKNDDDGNTIADALRYRMHQYGGRNQTQLDMYYNQIMELLNTFQTAATNEQVH